MLFSSSTPVDTSTQMFIRIQQSMQIKLLLLRVEALERGHTEVKCTQGWTVDTQCTDRCRNTQKDTHTHTPGTTKHMGYWMKGYTLNLLSMTFRQNTKNIIAVRHLVFRNTQKDKTNGIKNEKIHSESTFTDLFAEHQEHHCHQTLGIHEAGRTWHVPGWG